MKIILSPSKTQNEHLREEQCLPSPLFPKKTGTLIMALKAHDKEALSRVMKIKGHLLDQTYEDYQSFDHQVLKSAIKSYNGTVFKKANVSSWTEEDLAWAHANIYILSALYGINRPLEGIGHYRLDMTMKPEKIGQLYAFWEEIIERFIEDQMTKGELLVDLSSKEFSKMVGLPKIEIAFKTNKNGQYKNIATYSKMARGLYLKYLIDQRSVIEGLERLGDHQGLLDVLKAFKEGYTFAPELSSEKVLTFLQ